jgi:hypothetical protein
MDKQEEADDCRKEPKPTTNLLPTPREESREEREGAIYL